MVDEIGCVTTRVPDVNVVKDCAISELTTAGTEKETDWVMVEPPDMNVVRD